MWTHNEEEKKELDKKRVSGRLPGYKIPKEINFTTNLESTIKDKDLIVMAIPAFAFEDVTIKMSKFINKKQPVLIATKGIQQNTCLFLNEVFVKYLKNSYAVISGPTFAVDMIKNAPIGFSLATKSTKTEMIIRRCFENDTTKFRRSRDVVGIEICGSIKNVMAIASGMLDGMGATDSTRALFLTESMNDILADEQYLPVFLYTFYVRFYSYKIHLKPCMKITEGTGDYSNPYILEDKC
jgi:glycerol-3-phosphate dehydrogenase (NAD(P)+)